MNRKKYIISGCRFRILPKIKGLTRLFSAICAIANTIKTSIIANSPDLNAVNKQITNAKAGPIIGIMSRIAVINPNKRA